MTRAIKQYFVVFFVFALISCGSKENMSSEEKLAGESEKTWKAKKETNAEGSADRLTREEKREEITFWRNGNVKMGNGEQAMSGQWSLEASQLKLQFTGSNVSENFQVLALEDDELRLQAGDGSTMVLNPE